MSPVLKRVFNLGGCALGFAGVLFVILRLYDYASEIDFSRFDGGFIFMIFVLTAIYGTANILLARAWWQLLCFLQAFAAWNWSWRTYGVSQLAKYVPGNFFHLAGRQAMGMAAGFPGSAVAKSALWELGLLSVAGSVFVLLSGSLLLPMLPFAVSFLSFTGVFSLIEIMLYRWVGPAVAVAFAWQTAFLTISGMVFLKVFSMVSLQTVEPTLLPGICGAYVVAWLAGLVTPGAPAGAGIRELVLLFLLKNHFAEADLLLAVIVGRLVTVGGDLGYFGAASLTSIGKNLL